MLKKLYCLPVEHPSVLNSHPCLQVMTKNPHLQLSSDWFSSILFLISLPRAVLTVPHTVRVVVISLLFQSSNPLFINPSNSLVIVLLFMPPTVRMLFLMRFVRLPPWPLSEGNSKPTCTPRHTHLSLTYPWRSL